MYFPLLSAWLNRSNLLWYINRKVYIVHLRWTYKTILYQCLIWFNHLRQIFTSLQITVCNNIPKKVKKKKKKPKEKNLKKKLKRKRKIYYILYIWYYNNIFYGFLNYFFFSNFIIYEGHLINKVNTVKDLAAGSPVNIGPFFKGNDRYQKIVSLSFFTDRCV